MRLHNPREDWRRLKETNESVATTTIDAKLAKLQNIALTGRDSTVKYISRLKNFVNELRDDGQIISNLEKPYTTVRPTQ